MKTVYDIYHWRHPDACAELTRGCDTREQAVDALFTIAGLPRDAAEQRGYLPRRFLRAYTLLYDFSYDQAAYDLLEPFDGETVVRRG